MSILASCCADILAKCCVDACSNSPCGELIYKNMPSCVPTSLAAILAITLLVIGILGATSVIQMEPVVAYCGFMVPSAILFILACVVGCCKEK